MDQNKFVLGSWIHGIDDGEYWDYNVRFNDCQQEVRFKKEVILGLYSKFRATMNTCKIGDEIYMEYTKFL